MSEFITPPDGVEVVIHTGSSPMALRGAAGRPLPSAAVAWTWHGRKGWIDVEAWPWGQHTAESEASARDADAARKSAAAVARGNFDGRGRVEKLPPPDWERMGRPAPPVELVDRPYLPPGLVRVEKRVEGEP